MAPRSPRGRRNAGARVVRTQLTPSVPAEGFIRLPQVLTLVPIGRSTLWLLVKRGQFPSPRKLCPRVTAWSIDDVREWIRGQNKQPDRKAA